MDTINTNKKSPLDSAGSKPANWRPARAGPPGAGARDDAANLLDADSESPRQRGGSRTAPALISEAEQAYPCETRFTCDTCSQTFGTLTGLHLHRRCSHSTRFHESEALRPKLKRRRWTEEERRIVAKVEVEISDDGLDGKYRLDELAYRFRSSRTREALRAECRKERYLNTYHSVLVERREQESMVRDRTSAQTDERDWATPLRKVVMRGVTKDVTLRNLDEKFEHWLNAVVPKKGAAPTHRAKAPGIPTGGNRRQRRARMRAAWLKAYEKKPSDTRRRVLAGEPLQEPRSYVEGTTEYWKSIFETPSAGEGSATRTKSQNTTDQHETMIPITEGEVKDYLARAKDNAPGPDRIRLSDVRKIKASELASWFNVFLLLGDLPGCLKRFWTTLIPKRHDVRGPGDYRPISVGSHLRRVFSGILARRVKHIPLRAANQRGFQPVEGCAINIHILRGMVAEAIENRKELHYAFLDVRKAFDSVSHEMLPVVYEEMGLSQELSRLLTNMYAGNSTILSSDEGSNDIAVRSGVLQGDPLSPYVFNWVIDCVARKLDNQIGGGLGEQCVTNILFADDAVLAAKTAAGLRSNVELFERGLKRFGLTLNSEKCAVVHICRNGKRKKWYVDTRSGLHVGDQEVRAMTIADSYKYLGVKVALSKTKLTARKDLKSMATRISKSVLKPQHKLEMITASVIPKLQYQLDMGCCFDPTLKDLDKRIRRHVRKWTHLPHDTPIAMFHTSRSDGGLGIPSLRMRIPRLQLERRKRLAGSTDPYVRALVQSEYWRRIDPEEWAKGFKAHQQTTGAVSERRSAGPGGQASLKETEARNWGGKLYATTDGEGLRHHSNGSGYKSCWIEPWFMKAMKGGEFVRALLIRSATLKTPSRAARGEIVPSRNKYCRVCSDQVASLGHLLQKCARTHGLRVSRHDGLVGSVARQLRRNGWEVLIEPRIPVGNTIAKPDIVAQRRRDGLVVVLDPTIVSDKRDLELAAQDKVEIYCRNEVFSWLEDRFGSFGSRSNVVMNGLAMDWRGAWAVSSLRTLKELGIKPSFCEVLSFRALKFAYSMYASLRDRTR